MSPKTIVLDIDGCLANFNKGYAEILIAIGGDRFPADFDPLNPPVWFWERHYGYPKEVEDQAWQEYILNSKRRFWQNLEPLPDAREALSMLNARQKSGDQVWFVSTRMGEKAHLQTLNWLYEHGMDYPCLFFAADKVPYLRQLRPCFFIDDKLETYNMVAKTMHDEKWDWEFDLYLKDAAYNKEPRSFGPRFHVASSVKSALQGAGLWNA